MRRSRISKFLLSVFLIVTLLIQWPGPWANAQNAEREYLESGKLDVISLIEDTISLNYTQFDENGVPYFESDGNIYHNPSSLATRIYLMERLQFPSGPIPKSQWREGFDIEKIGLQHSSKSNYLALQKYIRSVPVIYEDKTLVADLLYYDYDYTYNGLTAKAPFTSAFAQSKWVQATTFLFAKYPSQETYDMVERAMAGYALSLQDGGFAHTFEDGTVWFEEIPLEIPMHILNAHISSLIILQKAQ